MPFNAIWFAQSTGYCAIAITLVLLMYIIFLRSWLWAMDRRRVRLWELWRPLCMHAVGGLPFDSSALPARLTRRNWLFFFRLWNHYLLNVQGESRDSLQYLGENMGLQDIALDILKRHPTSKAATAAIVTAGWLKDERSWDLLVLGLQDKSTVKSFSAARSLSRINARSAMQEIIPLLTVREDWPRNLVAGLLLDAGPEVVSKPLLDAILGADKKKIADFVRYLSFADIGTANAVLSRFMHADQNLELINACLKSARSPKVLPLIRILLASPHWSVRVEAANALGRLGDEDDIPGLLALLSDQHWWVRYRGAQAIGEIVHHDKDRMELLCNSQTDRYATDMIAQVSSEWELRKKEVLHEKLDDEFLYDSQSGQYDNNLAEQSSSKWSLRDAA